MYRSSAKKIKILLDSAIRRPYTRSAYGRFEASAPRRAEHLQCPLRTRIARARQLLFGLAESCWSQFAAFFWRYGEDNEHFLTRNLIPPGPQGRIACPTWYSSSETLARATFR